MKKTGPVSRLYRGASIEERRAERRSQLLGAAITVYGEVGYRNATVKAVCEAARLTERYFYESFDSSEELLIAAYVQVTDALHREMAEAGAAFFDEAADRALAILRVYFTRLREEPQSARVFMLEIAGISAAVDVVRLNALKRMASILAPPISDARSIRRSRHMPLATAGMIGAIINIAVRWVSQGYTQPIEEVVSTAVEFCRVALYSAPLNTMAVGPSRTLKSQ